MREAREPAGGVVGVVVGPVGAGVSVVGVVVVTGVPFQAWDVGSARWPGPHPKHGASGTTVGAETLKQNPGW